MGHAGVSCTTAFSAHGGVQSALHVWFWRRGMEKALGIEPAKVATAMGSLGR